MIHKLNYHDKWPTSDYELKNDNTGFVFLCYSPLLFWLEDKVGERGGGYHLPSYSVVPNVCVRSCVNVSLWW